MSNFSIDFFELSFLAEVCIPPRPIARSMFWKSLINRHYNIMSDDERRRLYEWIIKNSDFNLDNKECALFAARFNPDNQFTVNVKDGNIEYSQDAFLWEGQYYVSETTSIMRECIIDSYPKNTF